MRVLVVVAAAAFLGTGTAAAGTRAGSPVGLWQLQGTTIVFKWTAIAGGYERSVLTTAVSDGCTLSGGSPYWRFYTAGGGLFRVAYRKTSGSRCAFVAGWKKPQVTVKIAVTGTRMTESCHNVPAKVCYTYLRPTSGGGGGTTTTAPTGGMAVGGSDWTSNASSLRGKNGQRFKWICPANGPTDESQYWLWGTDVYDDLSYVCLAAVHAGVITLASGGTVVIEIRAGESHYTGSTRNGITSFQSGRTNPGSFVVIGRG